LVLIIIFFIFVTIIIQKINNIWILFKRSIKLPVLDAGIAKALLGSKYISK